MGLTTQDFLPSSSASIRPLSLPVVSFERGTRTDVEIVHATQMQQHIGKHRGATVSCGESKTAPVLGKRRVLGAVDGGIVGS